MGKCSDGNILPVDLDMSQMINSSQQLTNLTYDFTPEKNFSIALKCPSWLNRVTDVAQASLR